MESCPEKQSTNNIPTAPTMNHTEIVLKEWRRLEDAVNQSIENAASILLTGCNLSVADILAVSRLFDDSIKFYAAT